MGNGLAAFAAGFGTGYMNQTRQNKLDAERQEDRAMVKQDHEDKVKERDRVERDRNEMSDAGKFATVNQDAVTVDGLSTKPVLYESADVAASDTRQARMARDAAKERYGVNPTDANTPVGSDPSASPDRPQIPETTTKQAISVNGKQYGSTVEADLAAKTFNDGRTDRIANALYKQGRPDTAMGIQSSSMKLRDEQDAYGRRLQDEGVLDASKALRMGDGATMKAAFNKGGQYKIDGDPVVTPEVREIPGFGKVTTYNAKFMIAGPDGQPREMNVNSHDISMQTMSYEKQYDAQLKAAKVQADGELGQAHIRYYDKAGSAMETKAAAATEKAGNAVDRMSEIDKATLLDLNKDRRDLRKSINKGQAEGTLTEKSPELAALRSQLALMDVQETAMYTKYEGAKPAAADKYQIRAPANVPSGDPKDAAPIRSNNPGAMMPGGKLAQYKTPQEGLAAIDGNLKSYGEKGINTIAGVISRWAPPSANNTASYIAMVSRHLGIPADQKIDLSNPYTRHLLSGAITLQENGNRTVFKQAAPGGVKSVAQPESPAPVNVATPSGGVNPRNVITPSAAPGEIREISPKRGVSGGYEYEGKLYPTRQDAVASFSKP